MRGFPKHLNTKQDYLNLLATMPEETKAALKQELDGRFAWQAVKKLGETTPKLKANQEIRELQAEGLDPGAEPQLERWLFELKDDPAAWFYRLGFTVEEAEAIINS